MVIPFPRRRVWESGNRQRGRSRVLGMAIRMSVGRESRTKARLAKLEALNV
jgi:hypothetical protein